MAKDEAPTLFQVNGPVGLASWKDYCYDLKDTEIYKQLTSEEFALTNEDGSVPGIAYVIETYGLIYNKALLNDYFETDGAVVKSVEEEINSFETLKAVADDIQAKKKMILELKAHLLLQALMLPVTGDLRHIWQTFLFTMNM